MTAPQSYEHFRADLLSTREREVLDLAVEGKTDEQIAQAMNVSKSTINSYWVRIRGKVGQHSRTELVSSILQQQSGIRHADLLADIVRLTASEEQAKKDLAQTKADLRAVRGASWHLLALDHMPEATFVCQPPGLIVYANLQAQHLFHAEPGELEGKNCWELAAPGFEEIKKEATEKFFHPATPPRMIFGVESPFYVVRRDGTSFRAILIGEKFLGPEGLMGVVTVREAMHDVEALIAMLRKPFVLQ